MTEKPTYDELRRRITELQQIKLDFTKTKKTLEETIAVYNTLLESANDAIFMMKESRFLRCNRKTLQLYGCDAEQIIGKTPYDFSPERQANGEVSEKKALELLNAAYKGKPQLFEWKHCRQDGTLFDAEISLNRIRVKGKSLLFAVARDVTSRKQAEQELRAALSEIEHLKAQLETDYSYLREEIKLSHNFDEIIGRSDVLKRILYKVEQIAPTDATVLLLGETGVGKELFARAIHNASPRKERPLVKVNCAALPSTLIESELFGHEKGAFTGAQSRQVGRFELAHGTTLFLDEVGELPVGLQAKLLRVLQDGEFERVGSSHTIRVNVRVIAATNRNLEAEVRKGSFREDLWYRLNVFPITIPPLRERKEDIALITIFLVNKCARRFGKPIKSVPQKVLHTLEKYPWPGNVRELENIIERSVIISQGPMLVVELPGAQHEALSESKKVEDIERTHILKVLRDTSWKIEGARGAAQILGLNPGTLRSRMKKFGIQRPKILP
jgi:formate hydrogenlyase transcriptional activator